MLTVVPLLFSATPTPPTFPADFYTGEFQSLAINQGGYYIQDGACCSRTTSPTCKIQAVATGADVREQGSKNRTRSDSAQGTIVTWFHPINKQMALLPGSTANSSHKFVCAQYCPTTGDFQQSVQIGDGHKGIFDTPRDKGQATITQPSIAGGASKTCEHWSWTGMRSTPTPPRRTNPPSPALLHTGVCAQTNEGCTYTRPVCVPGFQRRSSS